MSYHYKLPVLYSRLEQRERRAVREQYVQQQNNLCWHCGEPLDKPPPQHIKDKRIDWRLFPRGFTKHPVHLQHDHFTDLTEGAVHALCNAVLWQYLGK